LIKLLIQLIHYQQLLDFVLENKLKKHFPNKFLLSVLLI